MGLPTDTAAEAMAGLRQTMVDRQIRTFDVTDRAVIARFLEVPREAFVPAAVRELAYSDTLLKIRDAKPGEPERRLLAPMVLARLIQAAGIEPEDRVLDVAPGTGYSTAILAGLAANVVALEADADLRTMTHDNLRAAGLEKAQVFGGPLRNGVVSAAPFDVILINGAIESHLDELFAQLREGGRLITLCRPAAAEDRRSCRAVAYERSSGDVSQRDLFGASAPVLAEFRAAPAFAF